MDARVSLERLDVENYATWCVRMRFTLISKGLWKHVINDGEVVDTDGDQKALALIGLSVMDHHLPSLGQRETAKAAWDALEAVYKAKSMARRVALKREMNSLKKAAEEPMTKYVARAKELRDQLAAAGLATDDEEVAAALLAGLPPDYDVIVAVLETTADKVDLDVLLGKLLTAEQRLPKANEPVAPRAYAGAAERAPHGGGRRPPLRCFYCDQLGHMVRDCPKARADRARGANQAAGDNGRAIAMAAVKHVEAGGWVLDSGASHHITNDASTMSDMRPLDDDIHITFANGERAEARGIGSVQLGGLTGAAFDYITLKDVLYVPEASVNLVSVPLAVRRGIVFDFAEEGCRVSKDNQLVTVAPPSGGVYVIAPSPGVAAALSAKATPQLWHRRYGHMGYDNMAKLQADQLVDGIKPSANDFQAAGDALCEPCVKAKHHKISRGPSNTNTDNPMELVHMDVCGPFQEASLGGSMYLATFVDDYSSLSVVRPIKAKSDVAGVTTDVINMLEKQSGWPLLVVRTDNGSEYINSTLATFFKDKGVLHQTTVRYTPEQNGKAERLNRTLLDRVRAMLEDSGLPKTLWAEAATTASYLRNRAPAAGRSCTPWEAFFGNKPDVSHLRVFGARAYALQAKELRSKLDSHAISGVMVGYEPNVKGYRILTDDGKVIVAGDVAFDETKGGAQRSGPASVAPKEHVRVAVDSDGGGSSGEDNGAAADGDSDYSASDNGADHAAPSQRYPTRHRRPPGEWWAGQQALQATAAGGCDPTNVAEALASDDAQHWQQAMDDEIASLAANDTWTLEEAPPGVRAIPVKWVFKTKRNVDGNVERYKERELFVVMHDMRPRR